MWLLNSIGASRKLRSSPLQPPPSLPSTPPSLSTSPRLAFNSLSQSEVTPTSGESNPFGQSTSSSLFAPGPFSILLSFSLSLRRFLSLSVFLFLSFAFPSSFFVLVLLTLYDCTLLARIFPKGKIRYRGM